MADQPPIPATGAYLGAWLNPAGISGAGPEGELGQLPLFEQMTSSRPAILNVYTGFASSAPISSLQAIEARGAIPLIAWGCAPVTAISAGDYDARIRAFAAALRALRYPVFLRWFWEMNLPTREAVSCLGSAGPSGYIAAWDHIWTIFHDTDATNVAFVWCPGVGGQAQWASFFPGAAYVDWIGADGYDRKHLGSEAFSAIFDKWYSAYSGLGKPMMVAETGATAVDQMAYLDGIAGTLPTEFPAIKAVVYFDAAGPNGQWELGAAGLSAFRSLASEPYFSYRGGSGSP